MMIPIRSGGSGSEGILQSAVEPLHEAVGLRMIGSCLSVLYGEERTKSCPQRRCELWASVTGDGVWYSESLDPALEERRCAVGGGGGNQRYRLWPASGPIHHCEKI
jgi:hypothetical protein